MVQHTAVVWRLQLLTTTFLGCLVSNAASSGTKETKAAADLADVSMERSHVYCPEAGINLRSKFTTLLRARDGFVQEHAMIRRLKAYPHESHSA